MTYIYDWQYSMAHLWKPLYRRKISQISFTQAEL